MGLRARATFWERVEKTDVCWEWRGSLSKAGYGRLGLFNQRLYAHRLSWEMTNGPIPKGMEVCHLCDNPPCVRPDHLYLGTHLVNMRDALAKGRHKAPRLKGEQIGNSVLTADKVRAIRAMTTEGKSQRVIAAHFGVSRRTVQFIQGGKSWRHVA